MTAIATDFNWFERYASSGGNPTLNSDGTITGGQSTAPASSNWFNPTTASIGSSYWYRTTIVSLIGSGTDVSPTSGTWRSLTSGQSFGVLSGTGGANVLVEISANVGGTQVVARGILQARNDL